MTKMLKFLAIFSVVLLLIAAGLGWYAYTQFQPVSAVKVAPVQFTIPKGQALSIIADRLAAAKLIKHSYAFRLVVQQQNLANKIQAGSFELAPHMTVTEIAQHLTTGTDDTWVTIPEGWRKEEIAASLARPELPAFDQAEFLELAAASEGKLYPDTYLVSRDSTAQTIYTLLTNTFAKKVEDGLAAEIAASSHSLDDALIMASLLERESSSETEMPLVSGILWNRIEIGMALQVDATLQYAKGYNKVEQSWWVPPLAADKTVSSPFNTYANPGLPPRPIASPGQAAIKAALQPTPTDALYYIHDQQGTIHTAKTLDQHNANVQKYLR